MSGPCAFGGSHHVAAGTTFCTRCGLIAGRPKAPLVRKKPRPSRRPPLVADEGGGIDRQMRRLIKKYGASAVEESFYLTLTEIGDDWPADPVLGGGGDAAGSRRHPTPAEPTHSGRPTE